MLPDRILKTKVLFIVYSATGEGITQWLKYRMYSKTVKDLVEGVPRYYLAGAEILTVEQVLESGQHMALIANLCPTLHNILTEKKDVPASLVVDVHVHQNYS